MFHASLIFVAHRSSDCLRITEHIQNHSSAAVLVDHEARVQHLVVSEPTTILVVRSSEL